MTGENFSRVIIESPVHGLAVANEIRRLHEKHDEELYEALMRAVFPHGTLERLAALEQNHAGLTIYYEQAKARIFELEAQFAESKRLAENAGEMMRRAESALNETWLDPEHGPDAWRRPTAEAYARVCVLYRKEQEKLAEVEKERARLSILAGHTSDEMLKERHRAEDAEERVILLQGVIVAMLAKNCAAVCDTVEFGQHDETCRDLKDIARRAAPNNTPLPPKPCALCHDRGQVWKENRSNLPEYKFWLEPCPSCRANA